MSPREKNEIDVVKKKNNNLNSHTSVMVVTNELDLYSEAAMKSAMLLLRNVTLNQKTPI